MNNNKIWCGDIPEMCGYGLKVYAFKKEDALKMLKKEFYKLRKMYNWNKQYNRDYYSFENALEYFGGGTYQIQLGVRYDDVNREW